jgi:hypothetical protein
MENCLWQYFGSRNILERWFVNRFNCFILFIKMRRLKIYFCLFDCLSVFVVYVCLSVSLSIVPVQGQGENFWRNISPGHSCVCCGILKVLNGFFLLFFLSAFSVFFWVFFQSISDDVGLWKFAKIFRIFWKMRKNQCLKSNDFVREKLIRKWGWVWFFGMNSSRSILLYLAGNLFKNWNLKKVENCFWSIIWKLNISLNNKNHSWKLISIFVFIWNSLVVCRKVA